MRDFVQNALPSQDRIRRATFYRKSFNVPFFPPSLHQAPPLTLFRVSRQSPAQFIVVYKSNIYVFQILSGLFPIGVRMMGRVVGRGEVVQGHAERYLQCVAIQ